MKKWMKKLIIFMVAIIIVVGFDSCRDKRSGNSDDEIYVAKDYATTVFKETMSEDCVIVKAKGNTGEDRKDSIYEITLTYTVGEDDEQLAHWYKVSVDENECTILEDKEVTE